MEVTLQEILEELKIFVSEHYQLLEYGFGDLDNISTKDAKYPLLWVLPTPSKVNGAQVILGLDLYVWNLEKQNYSNLESILSNSLSIGLDIMNNFWQQGAIGTGANKRYDLWSIVKNSVRMQPSEFKKDDVLAGYQFSFEIEIQNNGNSCIIPKA